MPAVRHLRVTSLVYLMSLLDAQSIVEQKWSMCKKRESANLTQSLPTVSDIRCVTDCTRNLQCMAGHVCQEGDGTRTCSMSSYWPSGDCEVFAANLKCKAFKRPFPCQNEGTLNPDGQSCTCVNDWYGQYCQRYRYDCSEAGFGYAVLQPKGFPTSFRMACSGSNAVMSLNPDVLLPGELNRPFADYQDGFTPPTKGSWMGLEAMYALTQQGEYRLTVLLSGSNKAVYDDFKFAGADQGYSFSYAAFRSDLSTYWDGFAANPSIGAGSLAGEPFSTYDKDPYGCAAMYGAGWWYDANCGPVLVLDPARKRGRWPSTITDMVDVTYIAFRLQLMSYY